MKEKPKMSVPTKIVMSIFTFFFVPFFVFSTVYRANKFVVFAWFGICGPLSLLNGFLFGWPVGAGNAFGFFWVLPAWLYVMDHRKKQKSQRAYAEARKEAENIVDLDDRRKQKKNP